MAHCWTVTAYILIVASAITASIIISIHLLKDHNEKVSNSTVDLLDASLHTLSVYPNGSYTAKISEFTQSIDTNRTFLPLNESLLNQLVKIDNTSFIFEAGRNQFLYFLIPQEAILPQRNALSLSGIGIYFDEKAQSLNIVPIDGQQEQQLSGVNIIPTGLPNRPSLLRIQITAPSTICSQSGISDSCTGVDYNAYLVFGETQLSATSIINRANVACGDVCSSSSSYSACSASCGSPCDGDQVADADTPVSRRYNLARKYEEFQFTYETYGIKDQIKVWNGAQLLFDSGCVGTDGAQSTYLTLSNDVNIRVDVEPNCDCQNITGCTGTEWYFILSCSEQCSSKQNQINDDNAIKLKSEGLEITNGMTLYINEEAEMPSLVASSCEPVSWEISFNYQAPFKNATAFSKTISGQSSPLASFNIIRSLQNEALGGNVTAKWTAVESKTSGLITFKILGRQPSNAKIMNYIGTSTPLWYAKNIAAQESKGGQQFSSNGYPLYSSALDNGYGIYQITKPAATYNEVWNWKVNVAAGIKILNAKTNDAIRWMKSQRQQAKTDTGKEQPVPDEPIGPNCLFSDNGNRTITDAVAIKQFNGAEGGNYGAWDNANTKWKFNRMNSRGENYVLLVCNQIV